ncbi:hypothetical protein [Chondromyces apiculatus]|uniref:Uncharacterized protein n=1 Tax=Chondromyces apiculatus DSM 436 TaxID=1192034 RepID=A0A017SZF0_9BACT|nr:hypothetical protein [Chondromyces apiculatus]EYF02369.1 Hypothetical protein CAP_7140 [Chondromyces apiculatus DSM 436]
MGRAEQFAKQTFAKETERLTHGGAAWQDPPETRLGPLQADGLLVVRHAEALTHLPQPWPAALASDETLVELKMARDHLDAVAVERALLRRQARQVQRVEAAAEQDAPRPRQQPLWVVAPHVPMSLRDDYVLDPLGPGCFRAGPAHFPLLWIEANALPLQDELLPFLLARSGKSLDDFVRWAAARRPLPWVYQMLELLPMSTAISQEILDAFPPTDDPERIARRRQIVQSVLKADAELKQEIVDEGIQTGRLTEARSGLRRLLNRRGLGLSAAEESLVEGCEDLSTLERWFDRAVTATSAAEALQ